MQNRSWTFLWKYLWPPTVFSNVLRLFQEWRACDLKDRALLSALFLPAFLAVGGLLFNVAYFVLFKLPSFILSLLGWVLLISLFSGAGLFFYERVWSKRASQRSGTSFEETTVFVEDADEGGAETGNRDPGKWFNDLKNMKWPR